MRPLLFLLPNVVVVVVVVTIFRSHVCPCSLFSCLQDTDVFVRKNAASACRDVVRHSEEVTAIVVKSGGAAALVEYVSEAEGSNRLPGAVALGFIASYSESLSSEVLSAGGAEALKRVLIEEPEDHMKVR